MMDDVKRNSLTDEERSKRLDEALAFTIGKLRWCKGQRGWRGLKNWEAEALWLLETAVGLESPMPQHIWEKETGGKWDWSGYREYLKGFEDKREEL